MKPHRPEHQPRCPGCRAEDAFYGRKAKHKKAKARKSKSKK